MHMTNANSITMNEDHRLAVTDFVWLSGNNHMLNLNLDGIEEVRGNLDFVFNQEVLEVTFNSLKKVDGFVVSNLNYNITKVLPA